MLVLIRRSEIQLNTIEVAVNLADIVVNPGLKWRQLAEVCSKPIVIAHDVLPVPVRLERLKRSNRDLPLQLANSEARLLSLFDSAVQFLDVISHVGHNGASGLHRGVSWQNSCELKLTDRLDGARPRARITVGDKGQETNDYVAAANPPLLCAKDNTVPT